MMDELKACPFCGGVAQVNTWTMHGITESRCFCPNPDCPNSVRTVALATWNTRPIEDALRAQLAARDALIERLVEAGHLLCDYAILVSVDHPIGDGKMAINDKAAWEALVAEWQKERETC